MQEVVGKRLTFSEEHVKGNSQHAAHIGALARLGGGNLTTPILLPHLPKHT